MTETTTAIAEYSKIEAKLATLRERHEATVWVVDTPKRMASAKEARAEVKALRLDLEDDRKNIKAPALARCKQIDSEARRINAEIVRLEQPIDLAIKEVENAKKREDEAKARAEEARVTAARAEIDRIRNVPVAAVGMDSTWLETEAEVLEALDLSWLAEFAGVAQSALADSLAKLKAMLETGRRQEEEQAKLAEERAELERLRGEQEAREAEAKRRIIEQEEKARAIREKADAEARELRAKQEAEARQTRLEEEQRQRVERDRIEAERRAAQEAERKEREAKEAEKRKAQRIKNDRIDALQMLGAFVKRFGQYHEFRNVIAAINTYFSDAGVITRM